MDELRQLFTLSADSFERIRVFRAERLKTVTMDNPMQLVGNGLLIMHIVPLSAFSSTEQIDLQAAHDNQLSFRPLGTTTGFSPQFNFDGFINLRLGEQNYGYTQIFRNGILEATKADIVREEDGKRFIPGGSLERHIFEIFHEYVDGLHKVGVATPLVILFTLEDVGGARYVVHRDVFDEYRQQIRIDRPQLFLPETIIDDYGTDVEYHRAIRPAFDTLWNAAGYLGSQYFDEEGRWVGLRR